VNRLRSGTFSLFTSNSSFYSHALDVMLAVEQPIPLAATIREF
jgi:hypothetical protein